MIAFLNRDIGKMPLRIQKWLLAIQHFDFSLVHLAGKENNHADSLSRSPIDADRANAESLDEMVCLILQHPVSVEEIAQATREDTVLQKLKDYLIYGGHKDPDLQPFSNNLTRLSVDVEKDLLFFDHRVVIPKQLRKRVMTVTHSGHIGQGKMLDILRNSFYWPRMQTDVENFVRVCPTCVRFANTNTPAPLIPVADSIPNVWEQVAADFVGGGAALQGTVVLTLIDYASRFPFAVPVRSTSAKDAIQALHSIFAIFGFPKILISDNAPSFTSSEFESFMSCCGIKHQFSSAYYPQSNGVVERLHHTMKKRLSKLFNDDHKFSAALSQCMFDIRSTTNASTGRTPFSLFFNRPMRTQWQGVNVQDTVCSKRSLAKDYDKRNQRRHAREFKFNEGATVLISNGSNNQFNRRCTVIGSAGHGAWRVKHADGRTQITNQRFMRPAPNECDITNDLYDYASKVTNTEENQVQVNDKAHSEDTDGTMGNNDNTDNEVFKGTYEDGGSRTREGLRRRTVDNSVYQDGIRKRSHKK